MSKARQWIAATGFAFSVISFGACVAGDNVDGSLLKSDFRFSGSIKSMARPVKSDSNEPINTNIKRYFKKIGSSSLLVSTEKSALRLIEKSPGFTNGFRFL